MRIAFYTLGCKLNQSESEALASAFRNQGFPVISSQEEADLYIINSCTVTSKSEQKARRIIRKFATEYPQSYVIVTGCYAQLDKQTLAELGENVYVVPHSLKSSLLELAELLKEFQGQSREFSELLSEAALAGVQSGKEGAFRFQAATYTYHTRAFLKIQDGCDNFCAYCRVPLARGKSISLEPRQVVERFQALEAQGYKEIVITGVNISSYQYQGLKFSGLIRLLLEHSLKARIRLSSLEPDAFDDELYALAREPRICPHFHIPVQSGSDTILKAMKRKYGRELILKVVRNLKKSYRDPFLSADIIVGFPGESREDFLNTKELIRESGFSALHVFPFSPRPGTSAWTLKGGIAQRIVKERAAELRAMASLLHSDYIRRWLGKKVSILVEKREQADIHTLWRGLSENYLQVYLDDPDLVTKPNAVVECLLAEEKPVCKAIPLGT